MSGRFRFWFYHVTGNDRVDVDINGVAVDKKHIRRIPAGKLRGGLKGTRFEIDLAHCPPFRGDNVLGLTLATHEKRLHVPMMEELEVHVTAVADSKSVSVASATEIAVDAAKPLNVSKADDVAQLKRLALQVGSDFAPNRVTDAYLKLLNIRTMRLINVGISGRFDDQGNYVEIKPSSRLENGLARCKRLGADPHVIIHSLPEQLLKSVPQPELCIPVISGIMMPALSLTTKLLPPISAPRAKPTKTNKPKQVFFIFSF